METDTMKYWQVTALLLICYLMNPICSERIPIKMIGIRQQQDLSVDESSIVENPIVQKSEDQLTAATGHHHGRVQIKVFRGPDTHGHGHEHFAPHGYWVKQPADSDHHH